MEKNRPTLPTWYILKIRLFQLGTTHRQCVPAVKFKFKTRKEDPSLVNAPFQKQDFHLLVGPIEQGTSCFE